MAVWHLIRPAQISAGRRSPLAPALVTALLVGACGGGPETPGSESSLVYPDSPEGDVVDDYHGTAVADPYRWLEELDADETKAWIDAQNAVSEPFLEELPAYGRFLDRLAELATLPDPGELRRQGGGWISRGQTLEGDVELVIRSSLEEPPIYRLDASALGLSGEERLDGVRLAPGGRRLAFTVSDGGSEFLELRVLDLERGDLLDDRIGNLKFDIPFWTADGRHLVYWRYQNADADNPLEVDRGGLVAVHRLGTSPLEDRVLYRDVDVAEPGVATWSEVSADGRFIVLVKGTGSSMTLSVIDLIDPLRPSWDAPVVELMDERDGDHTFAGNLGSTLYSVPRVTPRWAVWSRWTWTAHESGALSFPKASIFSSTRSSWADGSSAPIDVTCSHRTSGPGVGRPLLLLVASGSQRQHPGVRGPVYGAPRRSPVSRLEAALAAPGRPAMSPCQRLCEWIR